MNAGIAPAGKVEVALTCRIAPLTSPSRTIGTPSRNTLCSSAASNAPK